MASITGITCSSFLTTKPVCKNVPRNSFAMRRGRCFKVQAAKLPAGVVVPKAEPKLPQAFLGFTSTAEIWNSRACMIGLIGTFILELILHKGLLQIIGVEVGNGLNIPL